MAALLVLEETVNAKVNEIVGDATKSWADNMAHLLVMEDAIRQKTNVFRKVRYFYVNIIILYIIYNFSCVNKRIVESAYINKVTDNVQLNFLAILIMCNSFVFAEK